MAKPTDSQLVILIAAAQRKDGAIFPLPKSLRINKAAATMVLKSLIKRGLAKNIRRRKTTKLWRETGGQGLTLRLTTPARGYRRRGSTRQLSEQAAAARRTKR